jgi:hypothetical protein
VEDRSSIFTRIARSGETLRTLRRLPIVRTSLAWTASLVRRPAWILAACAASAVFSSSRAAHAIEAEVDSTTAAQFYEYNSPYSGIPTVSRRRVMETLALGLYHLQGGEPVPGGPEFSIRLRMRIDADPGIESDERTYVADSTRFVPGLQVAPIDLMYGYLEGRNLLSGWLGFRLGRQYVTDVLGWWAFDGGQVRITTPFFFTVEGYGGLEERGGLPLSTPRFEQNGVYRGDRPSEFTPAVYPYFLKAEIAPAFGAALESAGVTWLHSRLDYRKVINTGTTYTSDVASSNGSVNTYTANRTSSERIGYALDLSAASVGGLKGGLVFDLFNSNFATWYAQADWYTTHALTIGADYEFFRPMFDGDSIWNYFTHNPMRTITGRVALDASEQFDVAASGGVRSFTTDGDPNSVIGGSRSDAGGRNQVSESDVLGNLSTRFRMDSLHLGLRGMFETGDRGHRQGGDLYGENGWLGGRWTASARVSFYDWKDNLRPNRSAQSFAYVLGVGFRPSRVAHAVVEFEHDVNSVVDQRFRVLALLNLWVGK